MKMQLTVRNCPSKLFQQICPKKWEALSVTGDASVRFCEQCKQNVYYCNTDKETLDHARAGHCIARELPDNSELPRVFMGRPAIVNPSTPEQEEALRILHRERGIDDALKNINTKRTCPECDYPSPSWRSKCRVCGFKFDK